MGTIGSRDPVMPICAVFSRHPEAIQWAIERYATRGFAVEVRSEVLEFDQTNYYEREMGTGLRKVLLGFGPLRDAGELANWKRESNDWEQEFCHESSFPESRPLNLDPGYLTLAKLVLATTKDRDHRIYLTQGIFAEVTLSYARGDWNKHPWTYPDYQSDKSLQFLRNAREALKLMLRSAQPD